MEKINIEITTRCKADIEKVCKINKRLLTIINLEKTITIGSTIPALYSMSGYDETIMSVGEINTYKTTFFPYLKKELIRRKDIIEDKVITFLYENKDDVRINDKKLYVVDLLIKEFKKEQQNENLN